MKRWLKAKAVEAAPVESQKALDRATAVKAEIARTWDDYENADDMMEHVENWLVGSHVTRKDEPGCHGIAPIEVRGCMLREELYPLVVEVYQEKHPEDFAVAEVKPVGELGEVVGDEK